MHGVFACIGMIGLYFSSPYTFVVRKKYIDQHVRIVLLPLQRRVTLHTLHMLQKKKAKKLAAIVENNKQKETSIQPKQLQQRASKTTVQKQKHVKSEPRQKKVTKNVKKDRKKSTQKVVQNKQNDESSIYVGREDLKELRLYKAVYHAVQKEWRPPAGVASTCTCQITFVVGPDGIAHNVQVLESSKVLAYDIAARFALSRAPFEAYARWKQCMMFFMQSNSEKAKMDYPVGMSPWQILPKKPHSKTCQGVLSCLARELVILVRELTKIISG